MVRIQKKHAVFIIALIGIFSLTGIVYALAGKKALGSKKIAVERQNKPEEAKPSFVDPVSQENSGEGAAVSQSVSEKADVVPTPEKEAEATVSPSVVDAKSAYPLHKNITTTYFWAGEEAGKDNKNISNLPSAWDEQWVKHFGGVDSPKNRSGYFPSGFSPKENPFYFALPYNDFDGNGDRRKEVSSVIPWAKSRTWGSGESMLKNQWIKIMKGDKVAYAQWQDVGPFREDDAAYVFGTASPKSKTNEHAGLDVSPAVYDVLGLLDVDQVDWQFISSSAVPDGPWKKVVTTSQIYWQ